MSKQKERNSRHWSARPGKMERIIYNEIISNEERRAYAQQMLHMEAHTYWLKYRNEQLEQQLAEADKAVDRISIVSYIGVGVLSGLLLLMAILALM